MTDQRITQSDRADLVAALSRFGCHRRFPRNKEIYAEDDPADCWFMVVSGTVRICKVLGGRRRHITEFCYPDDSFGLESGARRLYSAEAVSELVVMRYPRRATEQLIADEPHLARALCEMTLRDLAHAQNRIWVLGSMHAPERVARFLVDLSEHRRYGAYLKYRCRVTTSPIIWASEIELRNRDALAALCEV
jgi:CRP/FNR family nitrogen fixation transcriptional regulator